MAFSGKELPVCLCNQVSKKRIESAIKRGARTILEVNDACGAGMSCGGCHYDIERLIELRAKK